MDPERDAGRPRPRVAVVGGGVAGLAAAFHLRAAGGCEVTVFEGSPRLGGKLAVSPLAGVELDEGAEAMLARRPEGRALAEAVGLGPALTGAATARAAIWSRGRLRVLPPGQVMGVPAGLGVLARGGAVSAAGVARAALDLVRPATPLGADASVADFVGRRLGREVVDRLVEPLLGGVYAGRVEELSAAATLPDLAAAAAGHRTLTGAARAVLAGRPRAAGPVFATVDGGLGRLPAAIAAAAGATVRTSATVRELRRTATGWRLLVGSSADPRWVEVEAVVLAVPAAPARRLLAAEVPEAAAELAGIRYASMAIVAAAYPLTGFPEPPRISGFLVPAVERRAVKAVTYSSVKWPHLAAAAPDLVLLRCSVGRLGEERLLQREDAELAELAHADLVATTGVGTRPVEVRVTRWGGALPQYGVGHLDRVERIHAALARRPGIAVCGAAYSGLGIPACVASGRAAAEAVTRHLAEAAQWLHGARRGDTPAQGS